MPPGSWWGSPRRPPFSVLAAACVLLAGLALVFFVAGRQASEDFFAAFARNRGLELVEEGLPEVTPLLYAGSERTTDLAMRGELKGGFNGTVAHYTYIEQVPVPRGPSSGTAYELTIVLVEVPGVTQAFPMLLCHGRHGSQRTDKLDDALREKDRKRLRLESEALNRRFEIFFDPDDELDQLIAGGVELARRLQAEALE